MLKVTKEYTLNSHYGFKDRLEGYVIVNISIGSQGEVCVLAVDRIPDYVDDMFPQIQTEEERHYKIIIQSQNEIQEISLSNQKWDYHFIQPIEDGNILLASARSYFYNSNKYDLNARIFDAKGNLIRQFLLGDGIQDLYVTQQNIIWTSYFDEGVFGNNGWEVPVGKNGLRAWDEKGATLYKYSNTLAPNIWLSNQQAYQFTMVRGHCLSFDEAFGMVFSHCAVHSG